MTNQTAREAALGNLVYVPGVFRCAKCNFTLVQSNLNASDGTVTARDAPGDKCPNDGSPMWRVSWKDWATENEQGWERLLNEKDEKIAKLERETLERHASDVVEALDALQQAEAEYRLMHDRHGDGSRASGRAWDLMRRAGDKARTLLSQQPPASEKHAPDVVEALAQALCECDWIGTPGYKWRNTIDPERGNWITLAKLAISTLSQQPTASEVEALADYLERLLPVGSDSAPDDKVQAFYIRTGELRELRRMIAAHRERQ